MPFKIVQTLENNKKRLFTVPSEWEDQNILKWPRKHSTKFIRNEFLTPETDWKQMRCTVKRRNIPSYETAEYVLGEMINHTDTEDETNAPNQKISDKPQEEFNLNIVAEEIIYPAKGTDASGSSANIAETFTIQSAPPVELGDDVYQFQFVSDNQNNTNQNQCCANLQQNFSIQNVLLSNQTQILEQLNTINKVQNTILQKVALFSVQLEDAVLQINADRDSQVTELSEVRNTSNNSSFYFKPVDNAQQLNELEKQLSESNVRQKLKNMFSVICSGGKGIDCAYTFADVLFSREFLCQCTWSGGSRGNDVKIAWKSYKNTLSFFWDMIRSWDKTYTMKENEIFFKNILKNSKKRKMAKNQRASTSRKRAKLSKLQTANDDITTDEEEDSSLNNEQENVGKKTTMHNIEEVQISTDKETESENNSIEKSVINLNNSLKSNKNDMKDEFRVQQMEKEQDNLKKTTTVSKEKGDEEEEEEEEEYEKKDGTSIKEAEKVQHHVDKVTDDSKEEKLNSDEKKEYTAKEAKNKDESNESNTSSNRVEKSNPKISKLYKMKREIKRLVKIKKNRPIQRNVTLL